MSYFAVTPMLITGRRRAVGGRDIHRQPIGRSLLACSMATLNINAKEGVGRSRNVHTDLMRASWTRTRVLITAIVRSLCRSIDECVKPDRVLMILVGRGGIAPATFRRTAHRSQVSHLNQLYQCLCPRYPTGAREGRMAAEVGMDLTRQLSNLSTPLRELFAVSSCSNHRRVRRG